VGSSTAHTTAVLRRHWRGADDSALLQSAQQACASVEAFAQVTQTHGSLLQSWIRGAPVLEFAHYPQDDVIDLVSGAQFYYHAHRKDGLEHGHVHVFWHANARGHRKPARQGRTVWKHDAPSHLLAVGLDARGAPVKLFTTNRWVTEGHWFDAAQTLTLLDRFQPKGVADHAQSCDWLRHFLAFYRPAIAELLVERDARLARSDGLELEQALRNHRLEVLSQMRLDWGADLDALQAHLQKRGLD
jgi:hypothetical protein